MLRPSADHRLEPVFHRTSSHKPRPAIASPSIRAPVRALARLHAVQVLDTSSVSSKLKPLASGQHYPSPPGSLTAWETHVSLMSHVHGFNSGGQVSLRFELLVPQVRLLRA